MDTRITDGGKSKRDVALRLPKMECGDSRGDEVMTLCTVISAFAANALVKPAGETKFVELVTEFAESCSVSVDGCRLGQQRLHEQLLVRNCQRIQQHGLAFPSAPSPARISSLLQGARVSRRFERRVRS